MLLNDFCSGLCPQNIMGSVRVHVNKILKVRVRFRFNHLKFKQFRFGSGSPKISGFYRFAVQVRVRFDSLRLTQGYRYRQGKSSNILHRQLRGVSKPLLGINSQVYCDILRQNSSAKSDFCWIRLRVFGRNGGPNPPKKRELTFSRYHMKPSGNERLH